MKNLLTSGSVCTYHAESPVIEPVTERAAGLLGAEKGSALRGLWKAAEL